VNTTTTRLFSVLSNDVLRPHGKVSVLL